MQNKSIKNSLYFIYSFTIITALIVSLVTIIATIQLIDTPREIQIPVRLNVDLVDQGYIQYEEGAPLDIKFSQIQGTVVYKEDNPADAPIAWTEIFFPLTRIALLLAIILLSAKIMQTSINEEPFISPNANRLKWIGYSFLLMGMLRHIDNAVGLHILRNHLSSQYVTIDIGTSGYEFGKFMGSLIIGEFPIGLFALFIAALFKHGIAIQEENALTI